jgi:hypothetical protein
LSTTALAGVIIWRPKRARRMTDVAHFLGFIPPNRAMLVMTVMQDVVADQDVCLLFRSQGSLFAMLSASMCANKHHLSNLVHHCKPRDQRR